MLDLIKSILRPKWFAESSQRESAWIKIRADENIDGGEQDHGVIFMIGDHSGKVSIPCQMTGCIYCIF